MKSSTSLNIHLTEPLRAFVDANSGNGTLYATPSEFVRALLREKKERKECARAREQIREGYQDLIHGRYLKYEGDLDALWAEAEHCDRKGW
jgi:antitoxin ParD1/3/4